jgi:hypothetical protein
MNVWTLMTNKNEEDTKFWMWMHITLTIGIYVDLDSYAMEAKQLS